MELEKQIGAITQWLLSDDTGLSSKAIVAAATGCEGIMHYPSDPADIGRCFRLLNKIPIAHGIAKMAEVCPVWKALWEHWSELYNLMDEEVGIGWTKGTSAPRTYHRMKELIAEGYANKKG